MTPNLPKVSARPRCDTPCASSLLPHGAGGRKTSCSKKTRVSAVEAGTFVNFPKKPAWLFFSRTFFRPPSASHPETLLKRLAPGHPETWHAVGQPVSVRASGCASSTKWRATRTSRSMQTSGRERRRQCKPAAHRPPTSNASTTKRQRSENTSSW